MKQNVIDFLKLNGIEVDEKMLQLPKIKEHGDLCLPCFILSKQENKNPVEFCKELEEKLNTTSPSFISKIQAVGPFLNFTFNSDIYSKELIEKINSNASTKSPQKILIEYPSPNTNKNLHIGHARNMLLGNSLISILKEVGNTVISTNLNNDRGISICYAMLGYLKYKDEKTPQDLNLKPDEYIAWCYCQISNQIKKEEEKLGKGNSPTQKEAMDMLIKWEGGDDNIRRVWKEVLELVYLGYSKTYSRYCLQVFDREFYESEIYDKGKEIIEKALEQGVRGMFKDESGAIGINLENDDKSKDLGVKYLLRSNKTTLYMTQDVYLAKLKEELFQADRNVFIVGHEQEYHFNVLFEVLRRFGLNDNDKNYHFSYGYVFDKDGKKFSSRLGNTIGADEIYEICVQKAKENIVSREYSKQLSDEEIEKRSTVIGFGALSFYFLKSAPTHSINFDIEQALSFEGETGPYVQYTYARINSLLKKAQFKYDLIDSKSLEFETEHIAILEQLSRYNEVVLNAASKYKVSLLPHYLLQLTKLFNELYQREQFIGSKREAELLTLSYYVTLTIKKGFDLLHIGVLEEM